MTHYLAIDQGTHATRATLCDARGQKLASASINLSASHHDHLMIEYLADDIVDSVSQCIQQVLQQAGIPKTTTIVAGMATQRSTIVAWDSVTLAPMSPAISWQDRRAANELKQLSEQEPIVRELTGLPLSPHYGASKIQWLLNRNLLPGKDNKHWQIGPLSSYLVARLTGKASADPANACRTLLYNAHTLQWDKTLCDIFSIPIERLPQATHTQSDFGKFDIDGYSIKLSIVTGDQSAAHAGITYGSSTSVLSINMGTGAFLQFATPVFIDSAPLLCSPLYTDNNGAAYVIEGTVNGAGAAVTWLESQSESALEKEIPASFSLAPDMPFFLNGISGLGSPDWLADFDSKFTEETEKNSRLALVLESIAFLIMRNMEQIERISARPIKIVRISGGLSANRWLCGVLASVAGIPIERCLNPEQTSQGLLTLLGCSLATQHIETVQPTSHAHIRTRYARWTELMEEHIATFR